MARPGRFAAWLAGGLVSALDSSVRVTVVDGERLAAAERDHGGFIYGFWHAHLLLAALVHDGVPTAAMISRHGDGELIARIVERRSIRAVRGSTTRGGGEAFRQLVELSRGGWRRLAITPDGPRGPARVAQPGIVRLAEATGFAIVPAGLAAKPARTFDSWDGFILPWPGARVRVHYGPPITVPADADDEAREIARRAVENAMLGLTREASRALGMDA